MGFILLSAILFILAVIVLKFKANNGNRMIKRILSGILYFILFFIAYYFVVAFIALTLLYFISKGIGDGYNSGLWAYGLIAGFALSPILSFITTYSLLNKK